MQRSPFLIFLLIVFFIGTDILCGCGGKNENEQQQVNTKEAVEHQLPETLRVATLYGPLSLFYFRDDTMGYDFSLIKQFALSKGLQMELTVASSVDKAIEMLDSSEVDVIAYSVPITSLYRDKVSPCGPEFLTTQVLVQNTENKDSLVSDVTELIGREVWVEANSKFKQRLENLNRELGGGIIIKEFDNDTISSEEIIELVASKKIPVSVVDSDVGKLNKTYYRNIDVSVDISFAQKSSWAVAPSKSWLGDSISAWFTAEGTQRENEKILKKYFELSKGVQYFNIEAAMKKGRVSPLDDAFRREAARIGWDWRLLAAIGYAESQFTNNLVSWAGARGIMQIMPATARAYGVEPDSLENPHISIHLAAEILKATDKIMSKHISDPTQRQMMVIAAYNSGAAHILDALVLAKKYGKNPSIWFDNVESALLMKADERFYRDPDVKYGYFGGRQTTHYVRQVFDVYNRIQKHISK